MLFNFELKYDYTPKCYSNKLNVIKLYSYNFTQKNMYLTKKEIF